MDTEEYYGPSVEIKTLKGKIKQLSDSLDEKNKILADFGEKYNKAVKRADGLEFRLSEEKLINAKLNNNLDKLCNAVNNLSSAYEVNGVNLYKGK